MSDWRSHFYLRSLTTGSLEWDGAVWQGDPLQSAFFSSWHAADDELKTARHKPDQLGTVRSGFSVQCLSLKD